MELTVECQKRPQGSKTNALRREGMIPAVLYGHNGTESMPLVIDSKVAENLVRDASINNTLIKVNVKDASWSGKALLREVQTHPWKNSLLYHISFFSIAAQDSVEVTVPLNFVGNSVGVTEKQGALDTVLTELQVQCAPDSIPETIDVEVTQLKVGDAIHVKDLTLPKGVEAVGEPDRVVVSVLSPASTAGAEQVEEAAEEVDPSVAAALEAMAAGDEEVEAEA
jgi:large subunit ribosomal protein L25